MEMGLRFAPSLFMSRMKNVVKAQNELLIRTPGAVARQPEKGAIGAAFLVWLFGGGLGLALVVFLLLKIF